MLPHQRPKSNGVFDEIYDATNYELKPLKESAKINLFSLEVDYT
jgi:hypothetical protein